MHAQTVLAAEDIEALKQKTGESNAKEAIAKAVEHYFECEYIDQKPRKRKKKNLRKRKT